MTLLNKIKLYCITCKRSDISFEDQVEQSCQGGADAVLFRARDLSDRQILVFGEQLKAICRKYKALFILDGRPDLAFALDADGVHLEQDDIPMSFARQIISSRRIVGVSASSLNQATTLAQEGADYVLVGPLYRSAKGPGDESGVDLVRLVKKRVKVPVIAFGGITTANASEAVTAGADGVAASEAICGAPSVRDAAKAMKEAVDKTLG